MLLLVLIVLVVLIVLLFLLVVSAGLFCFYGVNEVPQRDDSVFIHAGVVDQFREPTGFQAQAHAQHQVGVGNPGHVSRPWLIGVGVAAGRQQTEHFHLATADVSDPVGDEVSRSHDLQHGACGGSDFSGWSRCSRGGRRCRRRRCRSRRCCGRWGWGWGRSRGRRSRLGHGRRGGCCRRCRRSCCRFRIA